VTIIIKPEDKSLADMYRKVFQESPTGTLTVSPSGEVVLNPATEGWGSTYNLTPKDTQEKGKKNIPDWTPTFDWMCLREWDRSEDYQGEPAVEGWRTTSSVDSMARALRRFDHNILFKHVRGSVYHPLNTFSVGIHEYNFDNPSRSIYIDYKYRISLDRVKKCRILLAKYGYMLMKMDFDEPGIKNFAQFIFQP
jgi:hypothetical protein